MSEATPSEEHTHHSDYVKIWAVLCVLLAISVAGPFLGIQVVTLLTAFAYAELAAAIPEAGGGYAFVRRAFPGVVGFSAGWMLWFAYTVACSLYALGFAGYSGSSS